MIVKFRANTGKPLASTSTQLRTNQRLNNVTREQIQAELNRVRAGAPSHPGFGESTQGGQLTFTDTEYGPRLVLALEDRERVLQEHWAFTGPIGLQRFYASLARRYAGVSLNKVRYYWYDHSETVQRFKPVQHKNIVRPVTSKLPMRHLQIDLCDFSNQSSLGKKWILTTIDVMSKFATATALPNKEASTTAAAFEGVIRNLSLNVTGSFNTGI
jgi:hypothetical protein